MNIVRAGARFCTQKCRVYAHRAAKQSPFPMELTSRDRWVRRSALKRPLTVYGKSASSTNPATWSSFAEAQSSTVGVGMGYVLGDGIGCYDLDHCLVDGKPEPWVAKFIASIPERVIFSEVSQGGDGVHIFVEAPEGPGRKIRDGRNIERYSTGRYIAVTGRAFSL